MKYIQDSCKFKRARETFSRFKSVHFSSQVPGKCSLLVLSELKGDNVDNIDFIYWIWYY